MGWCYLNSEGSMVKSDWVKDGGKWYYLSKEGYWHHDGVIDGGGELDRTSVYLNTDGTGYISTSFWAAISEELGELYDTPIIEFDGQSYQYMMCGSGGDITSYTVNGDTLVLNIDRWGNTGRLTLKKTAIDQYTVTAVTGTIIDETITSSIPVGSIFYWY